MMTTLPSILLPVVEDNAKPYQSLAGARRELERARVNAHGQVGPRPVTGAGRRATRELAELLRPSITGALLCSSRSSPVVVLAAARHDGESTVATQQSFQASLTRRQ